MPAGLAATAMGDSLSPMNFGAFKTLDVDWAYGVILGAALGLGCNSDDREQLEVGTTGTTAVDPTAIPVFTTEEPVDTTSVPEIPIPERTCRDAFICASGCLVEISSDDIEAEWQSCFDKCLSGVTPAEWLKIFKLMECIVPVCSARPECMDGGDACNLCYVQMLAVPPLHGDGACDVVAAACK